MEEPIGSKRSKAVACGSSVQVLGSGAGTGVAAALNQGQKSRVLGSEVSNNQGT